MPGNLLENIGSVASVEVGHKITLYSGSRIYNTTDGILVHPPLVPTARSSAPRHSIEYFAD